jgi:hypothetical protein
MKNLKIMVAAVVALFCSTGLFASEFSVGADIMSRYIWRGVDFGNSPSIQPTVEFSAGDFAIGSWGAFSIDTDVYQELDLYVSYTIADMISIGVTDYFFPAYPSENPTFKNNYFNFDGDETGHMLEGNLGFECKKIPLTISANVGFYGADKNEDGDSNFSTYIEVGYGGTLNEVAWNTFIGITPSEGLYGTEFGVVNMGLNLAKEVKITESFSLPVSGGLIFNPQNENAFLVFGISL